MTPDPLPVNNLPVSAEAVATEFKRLLRALPQNLSAEESRALIPKIETQAREVALNRRLLLAEAERRAIEAPDSDINAMLANIGEPSPATRATIRAACKVEKLIAAVVAALPRPDNEEIMKYLREAAIIGAANPPNPELLQKLIDKTGRLLHRLRQNQALTEFIADLRKKAEIKDA